MNIVYHGNESQYLHTPFQWMSQEEHRETTL